MAQLMKIPPKQRKLGRGTLKMVGYDEAGNATSAILRIPGVAVTAIRDDFPTAGPSRHRAIDTVARSIAFPETTPGTGSVQR